MNDTNELGDNIPSTLEFISSEMKNRFQELYQLYAHADDLIQALEHRLEQSNQPQSLTLPSRER